MTVPSLQPGQEDQFFYLVQEYIDGQNLEEELIQKGKFSEQQVLQVLQEILNVLKFIHDRNILHRDIKPSNIMRRRDGKLFLLDFGAVKQVTSASSGRSGSSTGIYSMGFAPPEQIAGRQVYPSTDLYALAVTILTLLTGQEASKLFDAHSNQWQWRRHVTINPRLADILDKMLMSAANQRFQSADEVLKVLSHQLIPPTLIPQPKQPQPSFSTWELLGGAAFTGFEGALIAIALFSLFKPPIIPLGVSVLILGILIFAQIRRWIEKFNLLIISGITFALVLFMPFLRRGVGIEEVMILAVMGCLLTIAVTAVFRLVYQLLYLIF